MNNLFRGQWTGETKSGSYVIANVDSDDKTIKGRVSEFETVHLGGKPFSFWLWSTFTGKITKKNQVKGNLYIESIHHRYGELLTNEEISTLKKETGIEFPNDVTFTGTLQKKHKELKIESISTFPTIAKTIETFRLNKKSQDKSIAPHAPMRWEEFKKFALSQHEGLIYRGQSSNWPLQTTYHRTGYADLVSYLDNEIPELEHHINSVSNHPYDSKNDRSLGALLNLAQHHGYPTPLLDWTKSPYVAAFFAFENKAKLKKGGRISIFIFDEKKWSKMAGKSAQIRAPHNMVRTLELPGFNNPRVLPQQSMIMFSNVNHIENIIQINEKTKGEFLRRISIPVSDAKKAMHDLNLMGITWGSLFPGFDGICKQLKSRHFKENDA
ncbi:MAG: FRG domain-containing protein [Gammaproteobacteria bacterium]|nr:FRG domain-containing protein [Gammaproteobacteria bacterium]